MTNEELGRLYPVTLSTYSPEWPKAYEKEKSVLTRILGPAIALRIEHIGSTAVYGLSAKPTIDILVEIPASPAIHKEIKNKMTASGYIYMKEQKKHLMFVKGYTPEGLAPESFHVHMGPKEQRWLWDRVCFRDYLRRNPDIAREYERLKKRLSLKYTNDRESYTEEKGKFIKRITELSRNESPTR
ncbi:MAG: GrpB family protein [Spirochaetes bacterium]|nr:GrpB family protein [Spirochaetota bacterium]